MLPTDDEGKPMVDLRAFAKSLWATSDPDAKFGSLPEANLSNIVEAIEQALRVYGLMTQTPPHYLLGDFVNLSAEALLAADTTLAKKVQDHQVLFGEAWEQLPLAGVAAGDESAANDRGTGVVAGHRTPFDRSTGRRPRQDGDDVAGAPGALWERVPGATGADWNCGAPKQRRPACGRLRTRRRTHRRPGNPSASPASPGAHRPIGPRREPHRTRRRDRRGGAHVGVRGPARPVG